MKNKQLFVGLGVLIAFMLVAFTFSPAAAVLAVAPLAGLISSNKLKEQRSTLQDELNGYDKELQDLMGKITTENRSYTDVENARRSEIVAKSTKLISNITDISKQIELRTHEEGIEARVIGGIINDESKKQEDKELRKYSLLRGMNLLVSGKQLDGIELEMHQEAEKEMRSAGMLSKGNLLIPSRLINKRDSQSQAEKRAALAAGAGSGSYFVQTDVTDFIPALYSKNVLVELGARMIPGLVGNISIPKAGGASAAWEGENEAIADGAPTATPVTASPKRLGAYGLISKTLLQQEGNYNVEAFVTDEIVNAINAALQVAAINGGGAGEPTGILATAGIGSIIGGANGADPTSAHIISLEEAVATANADINTLAFLTNPKVRAKLKKTALDAGSGQFVWDLKGNSELMGYKAGVTTAVPSNLTKAEATALSAIIFGDFSNMMMLQWGGFDIVVNPYTNAKTNQLEIVINSFWDIIIRNAASFAAMKDAKTA